jgi:hypothetical protein
MAFISGNCRVSTALTGWHGNLRANTKGYGPKYDKWKSVGDVSVRSVGVPVEGPPAVDDDGDGEGGMAA